MPIVLVVDDESQIRDLLVRWLGNEGHQVREAATAAAALEDMRTTPADIVWCDVRMPGETGVWLTAQLRTQFPETAIILASGDRTVPPHVSMQAGVVQYLAKPFTRDEVLDAVNLAAAWHEAAVGERGKTKVPQPLPKAWVGASGS
jgi:DNA-binding NtrC family response regulator